MLRPLAIPWGGLEQLAQRCWFDIYGSFREGGIVLVGKDTERWRVHAKDAEACLAVIEVELRRNCDA